MALPYVGEIRMFAGNFAPAGWMFCEGQLLPINAYETLFNLIGATYGGDGVTTFALPDLRGRVPIHQGNGVDHGETGGAEKVTLTVSQLPAHNHAFLASTATGSDAAAAGSVLAASPNIDLYREASTETTLAPNAMSQVGGSQPHTNLQPYLCVNFIISLSGISPSPV